MKPWVRDWLRQSVGLVLLFAGIDDLVRRALHG